MRNIFILTAALAFLPPACQARTRASEVHQIERQGHILSGQAQAIFDQESEAKDQVWGFRDSSGHIFRIPQAGQPRQAEPYEFKDQSGNILLSPRSTK
jgi:hypothetical protein